MFFLFLILFLSILIIFISIFSVLIFHFLQYRLPEQDRTKQIVILLIVGSVIFSLLNLISFFSIPWDMLNF